MANISSSSSQGLDDLDRPMKRGDYLLVLA
jgi:hypothetical protein